MLTRASRAVSRNGYPHAIWHGRFGAGRIQNWLGCWVVTIRFTRLSRPRAVLQSIRAPVDALATPLGALSIIALLVSLLVQIAQALR